VFVPLLLLSYRLQAFTCWSTATGARVHNWGCRIDLVLAAGPGLVKGWDAYHTVSGWVKVSAESNGTKMGQGMGQGGCAISATQLL
jgi:hypothetical protein